MNQSNLIVEQVACPFCFRSRKTKQEIKELAKGYILVVDHCGACRRVLTERRSTPTIEATRMDILRLRQMVTNQPELQEILDKRIEYYNRRVREMNLEGEAVQI